MYVKEMCDKLTFNVRKSTAALKMARVTEVSKVNSFMLS